MLRHDNTSLSANNGGNGAAPRLRTGTTAPPLVAVIVPTKNEAGNVAPLVARLERVAPEEGLEVVFVDDSSDDTPDEVRRVAAHARIRVRLIHREPEERSGGLGGAVLAGLRSVESPWACVMDGDLQHPPELLAELLAKARSNNLELVVASRYSGDGSTGGFGRLRTTISRGTTLAARALFPRRLAAISDPMSGFFLVRRDMLDLEVLRPHGFKILLEIVARSRPLRTGEVPFVFGARETGESKASLGEGLTYLAQLGRLRVGPELARFGRFGLVGASGLVVNMLLFALFLAAGLHYVLAAVLATQGSTLSNLLLTERWVFSGRLHHLPRSLRAALFFGLNNVALVVRAPLLVLFVSTLALDELLANFLSLVALMLLRYAAADRWIWRSQASTERPVHSYDIHGIATIASEVLLPELEAFRVEGLVNRPTVRVRIGRLSRVQSDLVARLAFLARHKRYDEGLGRFGFGIDICVGKATEVVASPLLRRSPHVLYTNVVEPILRWTFVKKGYALVHAACIAFDGDAYFVTARTDTGKTTTILKTLDNHLCSFLSDDLTLLSPDGRVLTYPKPLTISRHTAAAVRTPLLSRWERLTLVLQSRLHSRSGRQFAMLLLRTGLPVATINAIVQMVVPPPKYHVERLVPSVHKLSEARLTGMIVIERGGVGQRALDGDEAVETLLANSEDAYGFAPYPMIAPFLHSAGGRDLRGEERRIVASGLANAETVLLRSETMDWWQRVPAVTSDDGRAPATALESGAALRLAQ